MLETLPPPGIDLAIRDIVRLLSGEAVDLSRIALDMTGVPHTRRLRAQIVSREAKIASDLLAFAPGEVAFSVHAANEI